MLNIFWGSPQTAAPKQQSLALEGPASKSPLLQATRSSRPAALQGRAAAPSHTQALSKALLRKAQTPGHGGVHNWFGAPGVWQQWIYTL